MVKISQSMGTHLQQQHPQQHQRLKLQLPLQFYLLRSMKMAM
jgi:hypothetical protein